MLDADQTELVVEAVHDALRLDGIDRLTRVVEVANVLHAAGVSGEEVEEAIACADANEERWQS